MSHDFFTRPPRQSTTTNYNAAIANNSPPSMNHTSIAALTVETSAKGREDKGGIVMLLGEGA